MNSTPASKADAITNPDDLLTILRDVSEAYELHRNLRRRVARAAITAGATYQQAGDAMGIARPTAHKLIKRDAA